jgi:hypothetical protein
MDGVAKKGMEGGVPGEKRVTLPFFWLVHEENYWYNLGGNWATMVAGPHAGYLFGNCLGLMVPILEGAEDFFKKYSMFCLASGGGKGGSASPKNFIFLMVKDDQSTNGYPNRSSVALGHSVWVVAISEDS